MVCLMWEIRNHCQPAEVSDITSQQAMAPLFTILLLLALMLPVSLGECDILSQHFHKELGCTPVYTTDPNCPSSFDCGGLEENRQHFCVVKQLLVDGGFKIEAGGGISSPCVPQCYCKQNFAVGALTRYRWECTFSDCPQYFRPNLEPGCFWREELKTCCPWKHICKKDLMKCTYKGVTYKENDRFYTFRGSSCNKCVCGPSFNGSLNDHMCTEVGCDMELHDGEQLVKGCAPIYPHNFCCPLDWRCPDDGDTVERSSGSKAEAAPLGPQCRFGNLTLSVGDRVLPDEESNCRCEIPPHVVCTS